MTRIISVESVDFDGGGWPIVCVCVCLFAIVIRLLKSFIHIHNHRMVNEWWSCSRSFNDDDDEASNCNFIKNIVIGHQPPPSPPKKKKFKLIYAFDGNFKLSFFFKKNRIFDHPHPHEIQKNNNNNKWTIWMNIQCLCFIFHRFGSLMMFFFFVETQKQNKCSWKIQIEWLKVKISHLRMDNQHPHTG